MTTRNIILDLELVPYRYITISSDDDKFYASITLGMMGDGVLEVGFSSINGALGRNFQPEQYVPGIINLIKEAILGNVDFEVTNEFNNPNQWMSFLFNIASIADTTFNQWLGNNQDKLIKLDDADYYY